MFWLDLSTKNKSNLLCPGAGGLQLQFGHPDFAGLIDGFQIFAGQDASAAGGYAHTAAFSLIDKEGYVRGVYMGTDPKEVNKLEKDIRKLLKYEYSVN